MFENILGIWRIWKHATFFILKQVLIKSFKIKKHLKVIVHIWQNKYL